jgi:hypothetical protein
VNRLWYIAYGSNTSSAYFASRFDDPPDRIWEGETWTWFPHELYFAGTSQTWNGSPVAFVSLERSEHAQTLGRAFLIDREKFGTVLAAEHLRIPHEWDYDMLELEIGAWCPLPTRAKYNAVIRLPDISSVPAFAITTARVFDRGRPSDAYLTMCRTGLAAAPDLTDVDAYLAAAIDRSVSAEAPTVVPPRPGAPLAWRRPLAPLASTGYPTVQLGSEESWLAADGPVPAQVEVGSRRTDVWLLPPSDEHPPGASPQVFRGVGVQEPFPERLECRIIAGYPVYLRRSPGISEDIEIADRIQVTPETAGRVGGWALLVTPSLSGPVSLSPREHVPSDSARVSYAARELWELDAASGFISLLPLDTRSARPESVSRRLRRRLRSVLEVLLGAPAVVLRATEAVVGDEGRAVVRVDASALDFVGVRPGEEVIVSWGGRETIARALLQTADLRDRMRDQLAQATGRQSRLATRAKNDNEKILWHLQAWTSPAVRDALVIPPDTVVRVRRSISNAVLRHLLALELPVGGLVIAVVAIPGIPWPFQVLIPLVALVVAFLPLRLSRA